MVQKYKNEGNSKSDLWSIGLILYYLYFKEFPFNNLDEYLNYNKDVILKKTNITLLDDLISKLLVKEPKDRITWENYFIHPFNKQQIIEINIDVENDNTDINILNNQYFNYTQLKDSKMIIDNKEVKFNTKFNFKKGKHKIHINYFTSIKITYI